MGTEAQGGWSLASLPDILLALIWPPNLIPEGLCVCNQGLARALLAAPSLDLSGRRIGAEGAEALAGTESEEYLEDSAIKASLRHRTCLTRLNLW